MSNYYIYNLLVKSGLIRTEGGGQKYIVEVIVCCYCML